MLCVDCDLLTSIVVLIELCRMLLQTNPYLKYDKQSMGECLMPNDADVKGFLTTVCVKVRFRYNAHFLVYQIFQFCIKQFVQI